MSIKDLIKVADKLDSLGMKKEADQLNSIFISLPYAAAGFDIKVGR